MRLMVSLLLATFGPAAVAGLLVTEVSGKAEIEGKGAVATLAEITDGQRLAVAAGAHIVAVDLVNGREYVLKGKGNYVVATGGPKATDGGNIETKPLPVKNLSYARNTRLAVNSVAQASMVMRRIGQVNGPVLLAPVGTAVISKTPVFRWKAVDRATAYRLFVSTLDGKLLWEGSTRQTEISLPLERELVPGENYHWRVKAVGAKGALSDSSASFSVLQKEAIARLDQLKPEPDAAFSRRVLYALALREAGASEEAKEMWTALSRERSDDEVLKLLAE
jgi:hypothetical protein